MKTALLLAAALAASPAFSASHGGRGGRSSSFSSRHGRSGFGSRNQAFGATALPRSSTLGAKAGAGTNGLAGALPARPGLNRFSPASGATSPTGPTTPCGPGCTAGPSVPGSPGPTLAGTINHSVTYGAAAPAGTQTVAAGAIVSDPNTALAAGHQGITWGPPDTPPGQSKGGAGGGGATPNQ